MLYSRDGPLIHSFGFTTKKTYILRFLPQKLKNPKTRLRKTDQARGEDQEDKATHVDDPGSRQQLSTTENWKKIGIKKEDKINDCKAGIDWMAKMCEMQEAGGRFFVAMQPTNSTLWTSEAVRKLRQMKNVKTTLVEVRDKKIHGNKKETGKIKEKIMSNR